ncbi:MAG: ribosome maturation factor RimM [Gammaproteobacteria bacterium]|nr:ribosome maturation factor RimM [Gammaproteobacteria bacterium]
MGRLLTLGRIAGIYGVKGWVRVHSYTEPREKILDYKPWIVLAEHKQLPIELLDGHRHGKAVVAQLSGCTSPEQAARYVGAEIAVLREHLPAATQEAVLWADLEGMRVSTTDGNDLGVVDHLLETGANDVLVVRSRERERLIPWLRDSVIKRIDLDERRLVVDWDPDF